MGSVIKKADCKDNHLSKILPHINFEKRRILISSFYQFTVQLLSVMFHGSATINKIKQTVCTKKYLRIVYSDKMLSFEKLLQRDRSVPVLIENLQVLTIEVIKVNKNLTTTIFH